MPEIVKLENPILNYAWGSRSAIAEFQGRPAPTPLPEAEVWIGDHPKAPSQVVHGDGLRPIRDWIAESPGAVLGSKYPDESAHSLPFLVKLLAASTPLSIQVHPDAAQASAGYQEEEHAGLALDSPVRNYRDPNPKHEALVALSRFYALCGFRGDEDLRRQVQRSGAALTGALLSGLGCVPGGALSSSLFLRLLDLEKAQRVQLWREMAEFGDDGAGREDEAHWVARLAELFPHEPLIAAPLLLNLVALEPLQALVVTPGTIHSYLEGLGTEVMTCSDNVIRAGLTNKHLDAGELRRVMYDGATTPEVVTPTRLSAHRSEFASGSDAFRIAMETVDDTRALSRSGRPGPEILLCVEGNAELCRQVGGPSLELRRGEAALIPACVEDCQVLGRARLLRVTGPRGPNDSGQCERDG